LHEVARFASKEPNALREGHVSLALEDCAEARGAVSEVRQEVGRMNWDPYASQFYVTRREAMQMLGEPDRHAFERRLVAGHLKEAGSARSRGSPVLYRLADVLALRKNGRKL